jgi:dTDP-4-dehydrorhamnose reductase
MMTLDLILINGIFGKKIIDSMKIFILGSRGMLGNYVKTYISKYFDVVELNRDNINVSNVSESDIENILKKFHFENGDVVINCIGTIKPRVDELGELNAILVNSVFPRYLSNVVEKLNGKMIHPTTDCVYDGFDGNYDENHNHNITDIYGRTKSLGEPKNCTVIRTSIIGEEVNQGRSLVEWVKSNENKQINGFTNHFWNGMTCLQFAKICEKIINENLFWIGTKHLYSNKVNKYELLELINDIYNLNISVIPIEDKMSIDRTLTSIYDIIFNIPNLDIQIKEMKDFNIK